MRDRYNKILLTQVRRYVHKKNGNSLLWETDTTKFINTSEKVCT